MPNPRNRKSQRGFVLILQSVMMTVTIAAAGLAVDVGTLYMIKARLSAAVDAAALAAGRSVNLAQTLSQAQTAATTTADQFFAANFPNGYLNSSFTGGSSYTPTVTLTQETDVNGNPDGILDFNVSATANAPTYFMRIFGNSSVPVTSGGTASRRGLVMMMVLDISSSMNTPTSPTACAEMISAAQNFITLFSPYDTIGLITFNLTASLTYAPSTNYGSGTLNSDIGAITCGSNTNTISALNYAYQQIKSVNLPLAENVILLFTDGSPNGILAAFPLRTSADSRYGPAQVTPTPSSGNCKDVGPTDPYLSSIGVTENEEQICPSMPAVCSSAGTVTGAIAQWGDQDSWGATTYGLAAPTDKDSVTYPTTCGSLTVNYPYGCTSCTAEGPTGTNIRQMIAYIPDTDKYGNNLHGVTATCTSGCPADVIGGLVTRDNWLYQVNNECSPDSSLSPLCKNVGDLWTNHSTTGTGSNFFTSGAYSSGCTSNGMGTNGCFRPDQPNSIVAASMNGTMSQAYTIRSDTTYHPIINVIYLTGNGTDSVDREFLPIVANYPTIPALPYDPTSYVPYTNPAYQTGQETGKYLVTADKTQLTSLFAQMASELLRLSK